MSFYPVIDHIYSFILKEFTSSRYAIYSGEKKYSLFHIDNNTINNNKSVPLFIQ